MYFRIIKVYHHEFFESTDKQTNWVKAMLKLNLYDELLSYSASSMYEKLTSSYIWKGGAKNNKLQSCHLRTSKKRLTFLSSDALATQEWQFAYHQEIRHFTYTLGWIVYSKWCYWLFFRLNMRSSIFCSYRTNDLNIIHVLESSKHHIWHLHLIK